MTSNKLIGIDIGGTKIHVGVVQDECIINEIRLETSASAPQEQILGELVKGIEAVIDASVTGIGIGVPGLVDEQDGIVQDVQNIPSWKKVHLKEHLENRFKIPVYITNDANSFVLGEKIYGKAKEFNNVVGLTLGTGLGAGIIIKNDLYTGILSSAGEFGGIPYLDLTLEDYCSGKFFMKQYGFSGAQMQTLAKDGDASALEAFAQFGKHLGSALKIIMYTLSPDAIFLGGSVSSCYEYFQASMHQALQEFPFKSVLSQVVIEPSSIHNVAILGAAALCKMKQEHNVTPDKVLSL